MSDVSIRYSHNLVGGMLDVQKNHPCIDSSFPCALQITEVLKLVRRELRGETKTV